MKPIKQLTNVDKAILMHQLFPQEIPAFIEFTQNLCLTIKEDEQQNRERWDSGFMPFDFWLQQINEVEASIKKYGKKLEDNPRLFSDKLFEGMKAIFTNHSLRVYTTTKSHSDKKYLTAFDLFYNT